MGLMRVLFLGLPIVVVGLFLYFTINGDTKTIKINQEKIKKLLDCYNSIK